MTRAIRSRCGSSREAPTARGLRLALIPVLAILAAPAAASAARDAPREDHEAAAPRIEIHELLPGVWIHTSYYRYPGGDLFPSNGLIVRDGDGLVLVDTAWGELSTLALLDGIEDGIGLPVRRAVLTHSHYDRLAGSDVLEARGVEVLAHALTRQQAAGQGMPIPDDTLTGLDEPGAAVTLGAIEVFYPGPGHAPDNLMVWLPSERVLFGGCAVRALSSASLGGIADADLEQWAQAIRRSLQRYPEAAVVVPGHGETGDRSLLDHTRRLLEHGLSARSRSPYVGEEGRRIKALSAGEVADLLAGKGMGYALAAELNGYPGPLHVLELAEELSLTGEQREQTQALIEAMRSEARDIGRELVDAEARLDRRFASENLSVEELRANVARIAALEGRLRIVHLGAHLEQAALLSNEQVAAYARLRGYRNGGKADHHSPHHRRGTP